MTWTNTFLPGGAKKKSRKKKKKKKKAREMEMEMEAAKLAIFDAIARDAGIREVTRLTNNLVIIANKLPPGEDMDLLATKISPWCRMR